MEVVNCGLCGARDYQKLIRVKNDKYLPLIGITNFKPTVVICKRCGLVFQNPQYTEEELERLYKKEFRSSALGYENDSPDANYLERAYKKSKRVVEQIQSIIPFFFKERNNKKILDIGSAAGTLLHTFSQLGFDTVGIEPNIAYRDYSINVLKLDIKEGVFRKELFKEESFDLITAVAVLEHVKDLHKIVMDIYSLLKPEGYCYIELSNINYFLYPLNDFFPSPHLWIFSKTTANLLFNSCGFQTIYNEDRGFYQVIALFQKPKEKKEIEYKIGRDNYLKVFFNFYKRLFITYFKFHIKNIVKK